MDLRRLVRIAWTGESPCGALHQGKKKAENSAECSCDCERPYARPAFHARTRALWVGSISCTSTEEKATAEPSQDKAPRHTRSASLKARGRASQMLGALGPASYLREATAQQTPARGCSKGPQLRVSRPEPAAPPPSPQQRGPRRKLLCRV